MSPFHHNDLKKTGTAKRKMIYVCLFFLQAMSFTLIDTQAVTNPPIELQILQFLELSVVINSLTWRKQEL